MKAINLLEERRRARGEPPPVKPVVAQQVPVVTPPRPSSPVPVIAPRSPAQAAIPSRKPALRASDFVFGKARTLSEEHCKMCLLLVPDKYHSVTALGKLLGITSDSVSSKMQPLKSAYEIQASTHYLTILAAKLEPERAVLERAKGWKEMSELLAYQIQYGVPAPKRQPTVRIEKEDFENALVSAPVLSYSALSRKLGCTTPALCGKKGWVVRTYGQQSLQEIKAGILARQATAAAHPTATLES